MVDRGYELELIYNHIYIYIHYIHIYGCVHTDLVKTRMFRMAAHTPFGLKLLRVPPTVWESVDEAISPSPI